MAIFKTDILDIELNSGSIARSFLNHTIGAGDSKANRFGVRLFRNGEPVSAESCTVTGLFIAPDGTRYVISETSFSGSTGTEENAAWVQLPPICYAVTGQFALAIKLTGGGVEGTMRIVDGTVDETGEEGAVVPTSTIPTTEELIAAYEEAVEVVGESVRFDSDQSLTSTQQATARNNINAENKTDADAARSANGGKANAFDFEKTANSGLWAAQIPQGYLYSMQGNASTGETVEGYAWNINGSPTQGENYIYTRYSAASGDAGGFAIVDGQSWGDRWPLIAFYNSSDELIAYQETKGNTSHTNKLICFPIGASYFIVNGKMTGEVSLPKVIKIAASSAYLALGSKLSPFGTILNEQYIQANPSYASVANLPSNYIYNIGVSAYQALTDVPAEFQTYGTLIKYNGSYSRTTVGGYSTYILIAPGRMWIAFDTGSGFTWQQVYPSGGSDQGTRTYLFIGDSYCQGYSHDGSNSGWGAYLATALGLSSGDYTIKYNGGAGFANPNNNFITLLNNAEVKAYTDIVVMGGFNDYSKNESDIVSGLSAFIARAKTLYPTAKVWVGCVGNIKEGTGESAYTNWQEVKGLIKGKVLGVYQTAPKYGAAYLNFTEYLVTDDGLTPTDGYHPSATGNQAIAKGTANALMTGSCCLPFNAL